MCYLCDPATAVALGLREQIVIPFSICMGSQVRLLSSLLNNSDIAFFAGHSINRIVLVNVGFDFVYCRFSSDTPLLYKIANMCDVFVCALMVRLVDACNVLFCHNYSFCSALFPQRFAAGSTSAAWLMAGEGEFL
jgi:hypothetical protein